MAVALSAPIKDPILIDPLQGTYTSLAGGLTNSLSLRAQDYPLLLTGSSVLRALPSQLLLAEETYNFPNPVRGGTTSLRFVVSRAASVKLEIFNAAHETIKSVVIDAAAGRNVYDWNVGSAANGVYFWKVSAGDQSVVKKALILR